MPRLELRGIGKEFPGVRALDHVSFDVGAGEVHALCGENGAGKSTLIKVLSGFHPAGTYEGEIALDGRPVRFRSLKDAEAHGIALIAQELALVPGLTVAENLVLGREPVRRFGLAFIAGARVEELAREALARVGLDVDPQRPVRELGIGQQQLLEIAKALAKDASILVLDEPTAALTEADTARLLGVLRELRAKGVGCVYISHRLAEVFEIADRITVLRDGRTVATHSRAEATPARIVAEMVGREVTELYPTRGRSAPETVLAVEGLSVDDPDRPQRRVLDGVSFEVHAGEVLGIGGLMGAGRTALVSALFGAARARVTGVVRLAGRAATRPFTTPAEAIDAGVALVSEDRKRFGLVLGATVLDNMTLATLARFARRGLLDHDARERAADRQAKDLRLRATGLQALAGQLSGGNQQKVVLGRWLMAAPRLLLLDEPTRGIDVGARAEIYEIVTRLAAAGLAVVLVSSDLPELLGLSHRVVVLAQGRRAAVLGADEATPEAVMAAATGAGRAEAGP